MSGWWRDDEGAITGAVAILSIAMLAMAGLAYDGGQIAVAHTHAYNLASAAARAGAQQVDDASLRAAGDTLDPAAATSAATSATAGEGVATSVSVTGSTITVTVTTTQSWRLLPLPDRRITATATAAATSDL